MQNPKSSYSSSRSEQASTARRARRAKLAAANATPRQRQERARRKAMGVALIERPLRLIRVLTDTKETDSHGVVHCVASSDTKFAEECARHGEGHFVRTIARQAMRA